jgi:uncharacterized protein YjbI with pentapeptide repeats
MTDANLLRAFLGDTNFTNANLRGAVLIEAGGDGAIFTNANLTKADLSWSHFSDVKFINANLFGAELGSSRFKYFPGNMTGATMPDGTIHE